MVHTGFGWFVLASASFVASPASALAATVDIAPGGSEQATVTIIRTKPYRFNERLCHVFHGDSYLFTLVKESFAVARLPPGETVLWAYVMDAYSTKKSTAVHRLTLEPNSAYHLVIEGEPDLAWRRVDVEGADTALSGLKETNGMPSIPENNFRGSYGRGMYHELCGASFAAHAHATALTQMNTARARARSNDLEGATLNARRAEDSFVHAERLYRGELDAAIRVLTGEEKIPMGLRLLYGRMIPSDRKRAETLLGSAFQALASLQDPGEVELSALIGSNQCSIFGPGHGRTWSLDVKDKDERDHLILARQALEALLKETVVRGREDAIAFADCLQQSSEQALAACATPK